MHNRGRSAVALHFFDCVMVIAEARNLCKVCYTQHLVATRKRLQSSTNAFCSRAADACIHLVEDKCSPGLVTRDARFES